MLAAQLREAALRLEVLGENPFKIRAYRRAADLVEALAEPLRDFSSSGELSRLPGIGAGLAAQIEGWLQTGSLPALQKLRQAVPSGVLDLLAVPGIGPRLAWRLYQELGIASLDQLEEALLQHRLRTIRGLGPRVEAQIAAGLAQLRRRQRRFPLGLALPAAEAWAAALASAPGVSRVGVAGSIRRREETVGDTDLVLAAPSVQRVLEFVSAFPGVAGLLRREGRRLGFQLDGQPDLDLWVVPPAAFIPTWLVATGPRAHTEALARRATDRGLAWLTEADGTTTVVASDGTVLAWESEEELYRSLGLDLVPPELRGDPQALMAAEHKAWPPLLQEQDVRGDLHVHTDWSDGSATLETMVAAAGRRGHEYLAICDHSRSLAVANGLSLERLAAQRQAIADCQRRFPHIHVLAGAEVEILGDGNLDYPDEVLADLDVVVAALHSARHQNPTRLTARLEAAIKHPHVDILAHPTGRKVLVREPYAVNLERLAELAARTGTALEVNASPTRLDLSAPQLRQALDAGAWVVINSDAHSPAELDYLSYGVTVARQAWCAPQQVLNTLSWAELLRWLQGHRRPRTSSTEPEERADG